MGRSGERRVVRFFIGGCRHPSTGRFRKVRSYESTWIRDARSLLPPGWDRDPKSSSFEVCPSLAPPYLMERCDRAEAIIGITFRQRWLSPVQVAALARCAGMSLKPTAVAVLA